MLLVLVDQLVYSASNPLWHCDLFQKVKGCVTNTALRYSFTPFKDIHILVPAKTRAWAAQIQALTLVT